MNRATTQIKDFTQGNITKQLVTFTFPLFLSNLLQIVYNMVDMMVVGNVLGKVGTSAVAVGGDVVSFFTFICIGFSSAGQVLIARLVGAGKRNKRGSFVGTMAGFMAACAVVFSFVGVVLQKYILTWMNTPPEAWDGAVAYSAICAAGLVFIYGYNIVSAILRGMGDSKHPFVFILISAIINVILDVVFVAYCDMGAGGAALATVISQGISLIISIMFLTKNKKQFELNIKFRDFIFWDKEMLGDLVKLGIPMAIKMASIQFSKLFVNSWINGYGVAVSAFAGIANKISSFSILISNSINAAGSTMVGQNLVAGKFERVKLILKNIAAITLTIAVILSVLMCVFPEEIFMLFTVDSDVDVVELVWGYIPIAIVIFFASALRAITNALLNGSGNYRVNFVTAIIDGIVARIGLALFFGVALKMEHYGFWLGDALAGLTPFFIGMVFYFTGAWKKGQGKE